MEYNVDLITREEWRSKKWEVAYLLIHLLVKRCDGYCYIFLKRNPLLL